MKIVNKFKSLLLILPIFLISFCVFTGSAHAGESFLCGSIAGNYIASWPSNNDLCVKNLKDSASNCGCTYTASYSGEANQGRYLSWTCTTSNVTWDSGCSKSDCLRPSPDTCSSDWEPTCDTSTLWGCAFYGVDISGFAINKNAATFPDDVNTWQCYNSLGNTFTSGTCTGTFPTNGSCGGSTNTCGAGALANQTINTGTCTNNWSCTGSTHGTNANCSSAYSGAGGVCGAGIDTCSSGSVTNESNDSNNDYWSCAGTCSTTANCSAPIPKAGVCGALKDTCSVGTEQNLQNTTTYNWECNGLNGGANTPCSAPDVCSIGSPTVTTAFDTSSLYTATFNLSGMTDVSSYTINYGDGTNGTSLTHNYAYTGTGGTYNATVTGTSPLGNQCSSPVTVRYTVPSCSATLNSSPTPATTTINWPGSFGVNFNGTITGGSGITGWNLNYGDNSTNATGTNLTFSNQTHTYNPNEFQQQTVFSAAVQGLDQYGNTACTSPTVPVTINLNPGMTCSVVPQNGGTAPDVVYVTYTVIGGLTGLPTINMGDGTTAGTITNTASGFKYTYQKAGSYTVTFTMPGLPSTSYCSEGIGVTAGSPTGRSGGEVAP